MQKKIIKIKFVFILLTICIQVSAQETNTGSMYSKYGIGDLYNQALGKSLGMGGTAIAFNSPFEINPINPASYSTYRGQSFLFQAGVKGRRDKIRTESNSFTSLNGTLASINAGFRLTKFWAMSLGISPLSNIGYQINDVQTREYNNYTAEITNEYYGKGGLNKVYLGSAFFYKGLSIGINVDYVFGPIVKIKDTRFSDDSNYYAKISDNFSTNVSDFNYRLGLQYTFDSLFSSRSKLVIGGYFQNKSDFKSRLTRETGITYIFTESRSSVSDILVNDTVSTGNIGLPTSFGLGVSYENNYLLFGFDFEQQYWKDTKFFNEIDPNLTNSSRYSFGMQYTPNRSSKSFFKNVNYRIGASYTNTSLNINNNQINDMNISFGFGIPFRKSGTKFNIGFEIGKRGLTNDGLIQENYYIMNLNFNMADIWFVKRKFN